MASRKTEPYIASMFDLIIENRLSLGMIFMKGSKLTLTSFLI